MCSKIPYKWIYNIHELISDSYLQNTYKKKQKLVKNIVQSILQPISIPYSHRAEHIRIGRGHGFIYRCAYLYVCTYFKVWYKYPYSVNFLHENWWDKRNQSQSCKYYCWG